MSEVIGSQKLPTVVITFGRVCGPCFSLAYVRYDCRSLGPLRDSLEQTRASWRRAEGQRGVDLDALQLDDDVTQIHSL